MAITMTKGNRYTFAALDGSPTLINSTDGAGETTRFRNNVQIEDTNGDGTGVLTMLLTSSQVSNGPHIRLRQSGDGNTGIHFDQGAVGTYTSDWNIGIDSSEGTHFRWNASSNISGTPEMMLSTDGDLTLDGDLTADDAILAGGLTVTGGSASNIDMADGKIDKLRELQMQDWDDDTNTNDTTRLFRRDGCWMFFNGAVAIGSFGNGYVGAGAGPSDASTGDLVIKSQIMFPKKSLSDNQSCISVGIDGEKVAYIAHFFDDDDDGTLNADGNLVVNQRAYIGYSASSNNLILQNHRLDSSTNLSAWPSFQVDQQGDATLSGALTQNSDSRLKDDIVTITNSLDTIKQLRGVSFNWNNLSSKSGRKDFGLIAQEVEAVIPELVSTSTDTEANSGAIDNPDGSSTKVAPGVDNIKSLSYATLAGHFVEAIKEQQTMIEDLKARIETLENA